MRKHQSNPAKSWLSDKQAGQSAVELALVTPLVIMLLLVIAQFSLLFTQKIALTHVSRETARSVALYNSADIAHEAALAASNLADDKLLVEVLGDTSPGEIFTVRITYQASTDLPVIGNLLGDVTLTSQTSMRSEG